MTVEVPVYRAPPAACFAVHPLTLPTGSTSEDVEREQHALILRYESQVLACRDVTGETPTR